jgi:hypothetical protein
MFKKSKNGLSKYTVTKQSEAQSVDSLEVPQFGASSLSKNSRILWLLLIANIFVLAFILSLQIVAQGCIQLPQ